MGTFLSCKTTTNTNKIPIPEPVIFDNQEGGSISFTPGKGYNGGIVTVSAEFDKEIQSVNYGCRYYYSRSQDSASDLKETKIVTSGNLPDGKKWSDKIELTASFLRKLGKPGELLYPGEQEIVVTGIPKDGSTPVTLYGTIEILPEPEIKVEYDRKKINEAQQLVVTSTAALGYVTVKTQDGKNITLETEDGFTFDTEITLLPPEQGEFTVRAYDKYGFTFADTFYVNDDKVKRILVFNRELLSNHYSDESGDLLSTYSFKSLNTADISDIAEECNFKTNRTKMSKENVPTFTDYAGEFSNKNEPGLHVYSISPSKKYVVVSTSYNLIFQDEYRDKNNRIIQSDIIHNINIINLETNSINSIGDRHFIYYDRYELRESGPLYFILKWENDNELYLLEQTKDEDMVIDNSQTEFYPGMDSFVPQIPRATARVVKLSLDDFTITEVEGIKPPHPWVCYSDHTTGVTGYIGMQDGPIIAKGNTRLNPYPSIITNLDCSKQWVVNELNFEEFGIEFVSTRLAGSGYVNDELYAFLDVTFGVINPDYIEDDEVQEPLVPPIFLKSQIFALNMETGELTKITEAEDNLSIFGTYNASDKNKKEVYFILENVEAETYQVIRIDENLSFKTLSKCSYTDYPYEFRDKNRERFFIY